MFDMSSMAKKFLTSPEGQQMIAEFLSSPEGMQAIKNMVASPEGKNVIFGLLLSVLDQMAIPDEAKEMIRQALHGS